FGASRCRQEAPSRGTARSVLPVLGRLGRLRPISCRTELPAKNLNLATTTSFVAAPLLPILSSEAGQPFAVGGCLDWRRAHDDRVFVVVGVIARTDTHAEELVFLVERLSDEV